MDELSPQGEFHHFQLFQPSGELPISISILVHAQQPPELPEEEPLSHEDVLALHWALESFDGDFKRAFAKARKGK